MPPLVPGLCIEAGYFIRNGSFLTEISIETLGYQALDRLYEWFLGSLLLGPLLAIIAALVIYLVASMLNREMKRGTCRRLSPDHQKLSGRSGPVAVSARRGSTNPFI